MPVVDETGFRKEGAKSAGVQRQYSGTAGDGSTRPRLDDRAAASFGDVDARGWRPWLPVRRHRGRPEERAYYLGRGPADTPRIGLTRVAGSVRAVEECFERAKGDGGLADYEVRSWVGGSRRVTLSTSALAVLAVTRSRAASRPSPRERGARG